MAESFASDGAVRTRDVPTTGKLVLALAKAYRRYHRHRVRGLERLEPAMGARKPVLLVSNHCLEVVDPLMFAAAVFERLGRIPRFIGHETIFFTVPALRRFAKSFGAIPSRHPDLAERVLREDGLLMLYPGAGAEASLRAYRRERYRLKWHGRTGFVRLALRTGADIHFVAGVGIDDMFYQTDWRVPERLFDLPFLGYLSEYRGLRLQLGLAGIHLLPGVFPLPVRVTHDVSDPLPLDRRIDPEDEAAVTAAQVDIWGRCQRFLDRAIALRDRDSDRLDRVTRAAEEALERIGV